MGADGVGLMPGEAIERAVAGMLGRHAAAALAAVFGRAARTAHRPIASGQSRRTIACVRDPFVLITMTVPH